MPGCSRIPSKSRDLCRYHLVRKPTIPSMFSGIHPPRKASGFFLARSALLAAFWRPRTCQEPKEFTLTPMVFRLKPHPMQAPAECLFGSTAAEWILPETATKTHSLSSPQDASCLGMQVGCEVSPEAPTLQTRPRRRRHRTADQARPLVKPSLAVSR